MYKCSKHSNVKIKPVNRVDTNGVMSKRKSFLHRMSFTQKKHYIIVDMTLRTASIPTDTITSIIQFAQNICQWPKIIE